MAAQHAVTAEITGLKEIQARMRELGNSSQNRILRPCVAKGVRIIAKAMKRRMPTRRRGDLPSTWDYTGKQAKKSIGSKVKVYKGAVVGIIGPRHGFELIVGTRVKGAHKGQPINYDPANTFHLVDLDTAHTKGKQIRQQTVDETKAEVAVVCAQTAAVEFDKEVNRLRAKGRL